MCQSVLSGTPSTRPHTNANISSTTVQNSFDNHTYLYEGFCASHDNTTGLISFSPCPYFQSDSLDELERDSVWYTKLPTNISTLNAYICGPMNRKGRVCSECEPGYGPSITSVGFQIQCAKCVDYRYGILLYLFVELFPITVFYLVILVFQVSITSAPMTCYIMYSQLIVIWWSCAFDGEDSYISKRLFIPNKNSELFLRIILSIYDVWNLRFFHYLIPPFCISAQLRPIHIGLLSYASVFLSSTFDSSHVAIHRTTWSQLSTACSILETISQMFCLS